MKTIETTFKFVRVDTEKVFRLAVKHLNGDSARACLADARKCQADNELPSAMIWALRSIAHSVGILHPDYTRAFKASGAPGEVRLVCLGSYRMNTEDGKRF